MNPISTFQVWGIIFSLLQLTNFSWSQDPYLKGETWRYSTPAKQNMNEEKLEDVIKYLNNYYSDALLIIKDGAIVKEKYWGEFTVNSYHDIASCTKSLTNAAIGHAIAENEIAGIEQYVLDYFPQVQEKK